MHSIFSNARTIDALEQRHGRQLIQFKHASPNVARFGLRGWPDEIMHGCTECGLLYPSDADPDAGCPHCGLGTEPDEDEDDMELAEAA